MSTAGRRLLIDEPLPHVRRLTLNRPEKLKNLGRALKERDSPFGDYGGRDEAAGREGTAGA